MSNCPRIVIAATNSGAGKTSISLGLTRALVRRGLRVQTFKVGPDFLDPTYLSMASDRICYNLDSWMMGKDYLPKLFARATKDADIAIIEGVMGLYDGASPTSLEGSTAEVAKILKAPIALIANAKGLSRSFAAMVKGFTSFEEDITVSAVIANRCGSNRHKKWLAESLAAAKLPKMIGVIERQTFPELPSRHLGLVTADRETLRTDVIDKLADICQQNINIDALLELASKTPPIDIDDEQMPNTPAKFRLGIAKDSAFHFYYPDNLEALEREGCQLVEFSPINDSPLPDDLDCLYIGGGYPEEFAESLSANHGMRNSIVDFANSGKIIYAECGGLMYLGNKLITNCGKEYPMAGVLDITTKMLSRFKALGYVQVDILQDSLWGQKDTNIRGHEFHYSEITGDVTSNTDFQRVYSIKRRSGSESSIEGFQRQNILASYTHLHFASRPQTIKHFINTLEANRA
ncbi:MAG: cobyrinate a,c-diamide synthase [Planctomycetes bacterium]|nr:cobyrinate a,c-diamide synthase [Planctomycetota bacterium]